MDCPLFRLPATRAEFWSAKIAANRRRDGLATPLLDGLGWRSLWIWECALKGRGRLAEDDLAGRIMEFVTGENRFGEIREMGILAA